MKNVEDLLKIDSKHPDVDDLCILIVDDEPVNVKLLKEILTSDGYKNITSLPDGREVKSLIDSKRVDIILLDLNMPHVDGYSVISDLDPVNNKNCPPILVLTAQCTDDTRMQVLKNGARDIISKPFNQAELLVRVHNLLEVQMYHHAIRGQNAVLEEQVRIRTHELNDTRLQVIRRLGRAAEYRDNETGLHIIRMSKISALLGKACGLNDNQADLLLNASPMHDIGKIGIPDHILLKPGKLDKDEWNIMKTHAVIGADILSGDESSLIVLARQIALTHHEKWDGSGYPYNLKEKDIPLAGRIVAIADVFDALTSERPYKKSWSKDAAIEYLKENKGVHFDPQLVDLFMKNLPEIFHIIDHHSEPEVKLRA